MPSDLTLIAPTAVSLQSSTDVTMQQLSQTFFSLIYSTPSPLPRAVVGTSSSPSSGFLSRFSPYSISACVQCVHKVSLQLKITGETFEQALVDALSGYQRF